MSETHYSKYTDNELVKMHNFYTRLTPAVYHESGWIRRAQAIIARVEAEQADRKERKDHE